MRLSLITFLALFMSLSAFAQIEFFEGTYEEALAEAKKQERPIFVDCYTTWCGPCKRMAKTTFMDPEVGEFFNANYINLKLDMEKDEGIRFRRNHPVSAFPTLYFIDANGETLHKQKGAQKVEGLMKMGKFVLTKVDYSADYAKLYEEGNREPELIYNYVNALNKSKKSSLKVANDYIKTQDDMTTDFNLKFILAAVSEADSRIFDMLIDNRSKIAKLESEQAIKDKIEMACSNTAAKAMEYESEDLLNEAVDKMKKYYPEKAKAFSAKQNLEFYKTIGDSKNYIKCCTNYVKKEIGNDAKRLHDIAKDIQKSFATDTNAMKTAEKIAKKAADNGGLAKYYFTYADILFNNGKKVDALKAAEKSLELASDDKRAQMAIQKFIDKIKAS